MSRAQYVVVLHEDEWTVSFDGRHYGPYPTQAAAIEAAIGSANAVGSGGQEAEVLVQGRDNIFRTEWTYGQQDPYPPHG